MQLNNDYISRYRTVPAASHTEDLSEAVIPYLPCCTDAPKLYQSTPMHYHPEAEIIFVERGEWQFRCAADGYRCAMAGDLVIFPPYAPHASAIRAESGGYVTHCICFDAGLLSSVPVEEGAQILRMLSVADGGTSLHIRADTDTMGAMAHAFRAMMDALDAPGHCEELLFLGALCMFFGHLRRVTVLNAGTHSGFDSIEQKFARAVIDYSETHFAEAISTRTAAAVLNYSEAYFCRMFRRVFDMCYSEYISRLRISRVRPLLETMSVTDAAVACGFTHMSRFSKTFRRCTGMSPTEYRRMMHPAALNVDDASSSDG